jgi:hypothetical protein
VIDSAITTKIFESEKIDVREYKEHPCQFYLVSGGSLPSFNIALGGKTFEKSDMYYYLKQMEDLGLDGVANLFLSKDSTILTVYNADGYDGCGGIFVQADFKQYRGVVITPLKNYLQDKWPIPEES